LAELKRVLGMARFLLLKWARVVAVSDQTLLLSNRELAVAEIAALLARISKTGKACGHDAFLHPTAGFEQGNEPWMGSLMIDWMPAASWQSI